MISFRSLSRNLFSSQKKFFSQTKPVVKKAVCVLYDGGEFAKKEPRLLGCVENALGLKGFFEKRGIEFVVTSTKKEQAVLWIKNLVDDIIITTPFYPGYLNKERLDKAKI